jgi:hypothetical protein
MGEQSIRFGVTDGSTRRAATWKCWEHIGKGESNVYLACREFRPLKVSLHQSGDWRIAFTGEFWKKHPNTSLDNRVVMQWPRPQQFPSGMTLALRIITPSSAVSTTFHPSLLRNIIPIPAPPDNRASEVDIVITMSNTQVSSWPGKNSMNTHLVGSMSLYGGERLWVVHRVIDVPKIGNKRGKVRYLGGMNEDNLSGVGLRAFLMGHEKDGSRTIIDSACEIRGSRTNCQPST